MSHELSLTDVKQHLIGTWLHEYSSKQQQIGAWELLSNGQVQFKWHQAPALTKAMLIGAEGTWSISSGFPPYTLQVSITSIKSPAKGLAETVYMGLGRTNPVAFITRTFVVWIADIGFTKVASALFSLTAEISFDSDNVLRLQPKGKQNGSNPKPILWKRP